LLHSLGELQLAPWLNFPNQRNSAYLQAKTLLRLKIITTTPTTTIIWPKLREEEKDHTIVVHITVENHTIVCHTTARLHTIVSHTTARSHTIVSHTTARPHTIVNLTTVVLLLANIAIAMKTCFIYAPISPPTTLDGLQLSKTFISQNRMKL
jgi:hypothetical protein